MWSGSEVTWRGQRGIERAFQKNINRVARALEVLPSTPVAFHRAEGRSIPAAARLDRRQSSFALRLASAQSGPHHNLIRQQTTLGHRLRTALGPGIDIDSIERSGLSQGQNFPGTVHRPPVVKGEIREEEERIERATGKAKGFDRNPNTVRKDGSRLEQGGVGGGVA